MENERSHLHQILSNVDFIQSLRSVEKLDLVSFISKLPVPVAILEFDSRLLVVNQQFADIFQSDALFLNGKLLSAFSSSLYADFELALEKFATGEKQVDFEFYSKGHFYDE